MMPPITVALAGSFAALDNVSQPPITVPKQQTPLQRLNISTHPSYRHICEGSDVSSMS